MFAQYNPSRSARTAGNRKVFENSMVAHVWAQQNQPEGRSGNGNFYFEAKTIYSYGSHFPIAQFSNDSSVVWFTQRSHSVTTSMHIRYTRDALRGLSRVAVIPVPDLREFSEKDISAEERAAIEETLLRANRESDWEAFQRVAGTPRRKWPNDSAAIVAKLDAKRAKAALDEKIKRARGAIDEWSGKATNVYAPKVSTEAERDYPTPYYTATEYKRSLEHMRAKVMSARSTLSRQSNKSKADLARIKSATRIASELAKLRDTWRNVVSAMEYSRDYQRDREAIETALRNIANGARRDYWYEDGVGVNRTTETEILSSHIRRALRADFTTQQIAPLWEVLQGRLFYRESDRSTAESIAIVHAREMERYGRKPATAEDWRNGAGDKYQSFRETLLRRKGDTLQTSRGAECPFSHAVIAFRKAQECRANGTTWHRNGQTIRVGVFQVDSIGAQGNMRAGCHTLKWEEMERLAIREVPHLVKPRFGLPVVL